LENCSSFALAGKNKGAARQLVIMENVAVEQYQLGDFVRSSIEIEVERNNKNWHVEDSLFINCLRC